MSEKELSKMDLKGFVFFFDENDNAGAGTKPELSIEGEYDLAVRYLDFFKDDKSEWTVLISGGWIGVDVVLFSKHVKRVVALEPIKWTYRKMMLNLSTNSCHNVDSFNLGFWDSDGLMDFNIIFTSGVSGILINWVENEIIGNEICECMRWDTFMKEHDYNIDLCIIDIEGAEGRLIKSMTASLPKRLIIAGYHPSSLLHEWENELLEKGYKKLGHIIDNNLNVHSHCYELVK